MHSPNKSFWIHERKTDRNIGIEKSTIIVLLSHCQQLIEQPSRKLAKTFKSVYVGECLWGAWKHQTQTPQLGRWKCFKIDLWWWCPAHCDPMDYSTRLPCPPPLLEFAQKHVQWVGDTIQPSHPLLPPSLPALSLSSIRVFSKEGFSYQVMVTLLSKVARNHLFVHLKYINFIICKL